MNKIIKKLKRFCNQTHVHKALSVIYQACLIAALAVGILIIVVYGINAVAS